MRATRHVGWTLPCARLRDTRQSFAQVAVVLGRPSKGRGSGAPHPVNGGDLPEIQDQFQRVIARPAGHGVSRDWPGCRQRGDRQPRRARAHRRTRHRPPWASGVDRAARRPPVPRPTLGANHDADAGMIRLESPPADLPFASVSQDPKLAVGEWVVTTGEPGGIVSDAHRRFGSAGCVLSRDDDMLCTDCKLVGGDSGGPLFNMRGEVVGIHSSIGPMITHNFHVPVAAFRAQLGSSASGRAVGRRVRRAGHRTAPCSASPAIASPGGASSPT